MKQQLTYDEWIALIAILIRAEKDSIDDADAKRAVDLLKRIETGDSYVGEWRNEWVIALEYR